ncbi:MAG: aldo/keto reductase [Lachnospiraceae bacterium]
MSVDVTKMPKLGFGLMRLPEKDGELDLEQLCKMVDAYMASGMNYFDTAKKRKTIWYVMAVLRKKIREHYQKSAGRALSA